MRITLVCCIVLAVGVSRSYGRVFSRCELAQELKRQNFDDLPNWVCLVEGESSRDTNVVGPPNTDGSRDHGLFQINDRYWCDTEGNGKGCNINCERVQTDDITEASKCAQLIFKGSGFDAWNAWKSKCKGQPLPDLSECNV